MSRDFDIVVLGATGYSGKLVAEHLAQVADTLTWAVAGRNATKLQEAFPAVQSSNILVVNVNNEENLMAMCRRTRVVIACAGPFDQIGMKVVDACVKCQTHYVDITGEFQYVRKMIETYDEAAKAARVMLVPCCGFDSVPSEMGNWSVHQLAKQLGSNEPTSVEGYFAVSGGASGGTLASIAHLFSSIERKDLSPVSLNPKDAPKPVAAPRVKGVSYNSFLTRHVGPFLMASINERVVRRSNALSGRSASYCEAAYGSLLQMLGAAAVMYVFGLVMSVPPLRSFLVTYVFPASGTGPSAASKQQSFYRAHFVGTLPDQSKVEVQMRDTRDAYTATGVFAASCGIVAANLAAADSVPRGGVLTASTAFGQALYDKLRDAGITFTTRVTSRGSRSLLSK